jgi:hypothetical protein
MVTPLVPPSAPSAIVCASAVAHVPFGGALASTAVCGHIAVVVVVVVVVDVVVVVVVPPVPPVPPLPPPPGPHPAPAQVTNVTGNASAANQILSEFKATS